MKKFWTKRTRNILTIILGVLLALILGMYSKSMIQSKVHTTNVVVALTDIAPNQPITSDQLNPNAKMVISEVPSDAITDISQLDLKDTFTSEYGFKKGEPIRKSYVTSAKDSRLGTSVGLAKGMVEIGVKTDLAQSAGNGIHPGIFVQVQAFLTNGVEGRGVTKSDDDMKKILVKRVVNSEGLSTEENKENGNMVPAAVVLEVSPDQARRIMLYQETGKVYLSPAGVK